MFNYFRLPCLLLSYLILSYLASLIPNFSAITASLRLTLEKRLQMY